MQVRGVVIGVVLIIIGLATSVYGMNMTKPEDPLSGTYYAIIGIFLGIAGLLVLFSHIFRGSLVST